MQIVMPKLGLTMTEGTIARWLKAEKDKVKQGEILFEFENDKSVMEYESPAAGILTQILVPAGETVPCGVLVAHLETSAVANEPLPITHSPSPRGESHLQPPTEIPNLKSPISATPAAKRLARELNVDLTTLTGRGPQGRIQQADVESAALAGTPTTISSPPAITPVARRVASDLGVDWSQLSGSGPGGRVVKEDVLQAAPLIGQAVSLSQEVGQVDSLSEEIRQTNSLSYRVESLRGVRAVIARRMSESAFTAPHVTLFTEVDASALVEARSQINAELAGKVKISYNSLLAAIVARLLPEHPYLNASIAGEEIHIHDQVNLALAVDTERGLLVPVIREANRLDLVSIQRTSELLIQRALTGQSLPDDLTGGTFTLTNLGMFEVDGFTPIINPPQAAILGVGRIQPKPVAIESKVEVRQMITLSLSFDHRLVDGGPAARFLQRIKQLIERPFALLIPAK